MQNLDTEALLTLGIILLVHLMLAIKPDVLNFFFLLVQRIGIAVGYIGKGEPALRARISFIRVYGIIISLLFLGGLIWNLMVLDGVGLMQIEPNNQVSDDKPISEEKPVANETNAESTIKDADIKQFQCIGKADVNLSGKKQPETQVSFTITVNYDKETVTISDGHGNAYSRNRKPYVKEFCPNATWDTMKTFQQRKYLDVWAQCSVDGQNKNIYHLWKLEFYNLEYKFYQVLYKGSLYPSEVKQVSSRGKCAIVN